MESLGSSPGKAKEPMLEDNLGEEIPSTGKKFPIRAENPTLPPHAEPAFPQFAVDDLSAGNHNYVINRKERGLLGLFRSRDKIVPVPIRIEIDPVTLHLAFAETLFGYLDNTLRRKDVLNNTETRERAMYYAGILANGCCIMTYLKVRSIIISEFQDSYNERNLKRPRVTSDHVIPLPFAYAIQQLGIVHVIDLEQEIKIAPVFPEEGHRFGVPTNQIWNSNAYYDAVVYAKSLGMQFGIVDLKEKKGTAWWLFRPYISEGVFELQCPIPETNFSSALAITYSLFLPKDPSTEQRVLFDTTELGDQVFGTFMRSPHQDIALTAFYGITQSDPEVWTHT